MDGMRTALVWLRMGVIGTAWQTSAWGFFPWMYPTYGDPCATQGWYVPYAPAPVAWAASYAYGPLWGCPSLPMCQPCDPCGTVGGCPSSDCAVAPSSGAKTQPAPSPDPGVNKQYDSSTPPPRSPRRTFSDENDADFVPPRTSPSTGTGTDLPSDRFGPRRPPSRTTPEAEPAPAAAGPAEDADPFQGSDPDKAFDARKPMLPESNESVIPQRKPAETAPVDEATPAPQSPSSSDATGKMTTRPVIEKQRLARRSSQEATELVHTARRLPIHDWSAFPTESHMMWR